MTVYGVVRIFRGTKEYCPDIVEKIKHWLDIGVDHIVVVVSDTLDKESTDIVIQNAFPSKKVSVLRIKSYRALNLSETQTVQTWSVALNEGIGFLTTKFNIKCTDSLLVFSNEVTINRETFEAMKSAMLPGIGVVGVNFPEFTAKFYNLFPRNTLAMYRLQVVLEFGGFSAECDTLGGMEDYYLMRILKSKGFKIVMIESSGIKLEIAAMTNQSAKEARELMAMKKIDQLLKERFNI